MKNGRQIGANFERFAARWLGDILGVKFRRTQQYNGAGAVGDIEAVNQDSPFARLHIECKGGAAVKIGTQALEAAWSQACRDCPKGHTPIVIHRERQGLYVVTAVVGGLRVHVVHPQWVAELVRVILERGDA